MTKNTHQTPSGVPLESDSPADQALWQQMESLPMSLPSDELRGGFYTQLARQKQADKPGLLKTINNWFSSNPWIPAFATLVFGVALGLSLQNPGGSPENNRLDNLQMQIGELNQMLALNLMENVAATERLRGINHATAIGATHPEIGNALLGRALNDSNNRVRAAAIEALGPHLQSREIARELEDLMLVTASPLLQLELAEVIMRWGDEQQLARLLDVARSNRLTPEVSNFVLTRIDRNPI